MGDQLADALQMLERGKSRTVKSIPPEPTGTVRLDVTESAGTVVKQWFVTLESGTARVRRPNSEIPRPEPDAVLRTDNDTFDRLVRGEERFVPLFFRNALVVEGHLGLVHMLATVLFAGPPTGHHPRDFVHEEAGS
ncbi:SCP2 sterol-binding domain-containing protein [Micromonospora sp. NPDC000442]|uniref:SCP2 sterol-binding domain-containing protein n=1 Tax=Micromonospora sp. NPDC000442 TaxID=3364217 RepID=UPI0036B95FBE